MKKFKRPGIIFVSVLSIFCLNILKANAQEILLNSASERFEFSSLILKDNLNDEFGPATDKLIKEKSETEIKTVINKDNEAIHPISNVKFDDKIKIKIDSINFSGNKVFNSEELNKYTSDIIGKEVTAQDLSNLADKITDLYKKNGYITSKAIFSPANIKDGKVEISVVEGKVGEININNNKWVKTSYIKDSLFKANDLEENKIFNINNLNNSLGELSRNNSLKGEITLQENKANPEKTDLKLNVQDRFPISINTGWDNMGRYNTGISRALINLSDNNLTGFGDKLYVNQVLARDTYGLNTGYNIPIGTHGTEVRFNYAMVKDDMDNLNLNSWRLHGRSSAHLFRSALIQPLYKNKNLYVLSDLSFDILHTESSIKNPDISIENQDLRVLRTGVSGIEKDRLGKTLSRLEVGIGLPILGGTHGKGFAVANSNFVKLSANILRSINLPQEFTGIIKLKGQYSPQFLPLFEDLQLGGMNSVRGFDQGYLGGNNGYMASLEVQRTIPGLPDLNVPYWKDKSVQVKLKNKIKFATFYDQGYARLTHIGMPRGYYNFLQSVGVGLRIKLNDYLQANLDLGIPLGRNRSTDQDRIKFIFNISSALI